MKRSFLALAIFACVLGSVQAAPLYGIRSSDLVIINPSTATIQSVVGPLNLPAGFDSFNLTYHPGQQMLYSLAYQRSGSTVINQHLVAINPSTGNASVVATLGSPSSVGYFESLEFVHSLNSLVASRSSIITSFVTDRLVKLNLDGTTVPLVTTASLDNDHSVYDPTRDYFYTADPNMFVGPSGPFYRVNLSNGSHITLGTIPAIGGFAYSVDEDVIYGVDYVFNRLYRIQLTNGGTPFTITTVGTIPGPFVYDIAFASSGIIPEPSSLILLTLGLGIVAPYCAYRRYKRLGEEHLKAS